MKAKVISVCNQKGGVGKSTTVVNLAAAFNKLEKHVLVLDMDPQANASDTLGINPYESKTTMYEVLMDRVNTIGTSMQDTRLKFIKLVPGHIKLAGSERELSQSVGAIIALKKKLDEATLGMFDFVLIDCPPNLGLLTLNALIASDSYIIPIQAGSRYALIGVEMLQQTIMDVKENINETLILEGVLITMYDSRTNICKAMGEAIRKFFGKENVFKTVVRINTALEQATLKRQTIFEFDTRAFGAHDYLNLAREILHEEISGTGSGNQQL